MTTILGPLLGVSCIVNIVLAICICKGKKKEQKPNERELTEQPQGNPLVNLGEECYKYYDINLANRRYQPGASVANDDYEEPLADLRPAVYVDIFPGPSSCNKSDN